MAQAKKTTSTKSKARTAKKAKTISREELMEEYKKYVLLNGHEPPSVFKFAHDLGMVEGDFYNHFSSFNSIAREIWLGYLEENLSVLHEDGSYATYSAREKMLSFYYTLLEVLKKDRSYVNFSWDKSAKPHPTPANLKSFKEGFKDYVNQVIGEGIDNQEIVKRPIVGDRYFEGLWTQFVFIINYWLHDDSTDFVNTDAAIEKSVNLSFELMGKSTLDTVLDFAKFLYQTKK